MLSLRPFQRTSAAASSPVSARGYLRRRTWHSRKAGDGSQGDDEPADPLPSRRARPGHRARPSKKHGISGATTSRMMAADELARYGWTSNAHPRAAPAMAIVVAVLAGILRY